MQIRYEKIVLPRDFPLALQDMTLPPFDDMGGYLHYHDCFEISTITEGHGRYHVGDRDYPVGPGDIVVINHIEPHNLVVGSNGIRQTVLIFEPEIVWNWESAHDYKYIQPFLERDVLLANRISGGTEASVQIREILHSLSQEYHARDEGWQLMVKAQLLSVLTLLFRHFQCEKSTSQIRKNIIRLKTAIAYIHAHYSEEITLQELADMTNVTPGYFCALFKSTIGVTYSVYVNTIRIRRAEQKLLRSDQTITQIAGECGYNSMSHFYVMFKKITGRTPTEVRSVESKKQ